MTRTPAIRAITPRLALKEAADTMDRKALALDLKAAPGEDGTFEGYASVFGVVDQGYDVVERGAFVKSLATRRPKMLWQHEMDKPIGIWDEVREDERGLYVKGRLLTDVAKGREALALLKAGALDSLSIGYRTVEAAMEPGDRMIRRLLEVDLFEISIVTFPMLPDAKVTGVKSITTERDFERFLREAGYSRSEAKAITAHGFKAILRQRDAGEETAATGGMDALISQLNTLKDKFHG